MKICKEDGSEIAKFYNYKDAPRKIELWAGSCLPYSKIIKPVKGILKQSFWNKHNVKFMILNENGELEDSELWLRRGFFTHTCEEAIFVYNELLKLNIEHANKQISEIKKAMIKCTD